MLFNYKALDSNGEHKTGSIDAPNVDAAILSLQKRGFVISQIKQQEDKKNFLKSITFFDRVSNKDVVLLSQQIATLFQAQVSALKIFNLLAADAENPVLRKALSDVTNDIQGGSSISNALAKHQTIFSSFYVNMVRAGEETGKLDQTFRDLAGYLDRSYEVSSKAKGALIYPSFVIFTFFAVMGLMLTVVIPKISGILKDSGGEVPFYTKAVLGLSSSITSYGIFIVVLIVIAGLFFWRYLRTEKGKIFLDEVKVKTPYISNLFRKLYLSRISDTLNTMISSGVSMTRSLEITAEVVGNSIYRKVIEDSLIAVKGGSSLSDSFSKYPEIPAMLTQMVRVGEETGELGSILKTVSAFYEREVTNAVDTLVSLIEPALIVALGLGVGLLLASVLIPIYNIASVGV